MSLRSLSRSLVGGERARWRLSSRSRRLSGEEGRLRSEDEVVFAEGLLDANDVCVSVRPSEPLELPEEPTPWRATPNPRSREAIASVAR